MCNSSEIRLARAGLRPDNSTVVSIESSNPLLRDRSPRLRLVRDGKPVRAASARAERIAVENRAASMMTDDDARAVLALRVSENLQGGRSALLTPERRRGLVTTATRLGLRPFDASLIIAIVQDAARRGEGMEHPQTTGRLRMIPQKTRASLRTPARHREFMVAIVVSVLVAFVMMALAVRWILGG